MTEKVTITLTQREWDHVLLAVEQAALSQNRLVMEGEKHCLDMTGAGMSVTRFNDIANEMSAQYIKQCGTDEKGQ